MIDDNDTKTPDNEAADEAGAAPDPAVARLEGEVEKLRADVLYAQAETQNVRRRLEREKADATTYAATKFARDMLSIADNLARALAAIPDSLRGDEKMKGLVAGLEATGKELDTVFARHEVKRIEALGAKLDPNRHQAMIEIPSPDAEPGTIVQEMQAGYMLRDRLLRPAMVGVAKEG